MAIDPSTVCERENEREIEVPSYLILNLLPRLSPETPESSSFPVANSSLVTRNPTLSPSSQTYLTILNFLLPPLSLLTNLPHTSPFTQSKHQTAHSLIETVHSDSETRQQNIDTQ